MKRNLQILFPVVLLLIGALYFTTQQRDDDDTTAGTELFSDAFDEESGELKKETRIKEALLDDFELTKDPALGYPPIDRLQRARDLTYTRQLEMLESPSRGDLTAPRWRERGPDNIGGRTRAMMIDRRDPTGNTVFAGGVNGGIWITENIQQNPPQWRNVDDYMESLSIGFLAQDPNNLDVMYAGTGEGTAGYAMTRGAGIFKSTDGGESWQQLPATSGNAWRTCQHLIVDPRNSDVYAAMNSGVYRSTNGGDTWSDVLSPNSGNNIFFDLQYVDGNVYASNLTNIYKSATGNAGDWDEITGSPFPANWSRLEFSVALSNPDVIYAIGNEGGGASNIWRTTNGGTNWGAVAAPTIGGNEFTNGQVWYDLDIAADPFDENTVVTGGVPVMFSTNGASSLNVYDYSFHVDQHMVLFDEEHEDIVLFGNDGGVYRSTNGLPNNASNKNNGYNVTQYYSVAMRPEPFSDYFLGGTQDNGSHNLNELLISRARRVQGGDGMYCHIDQTDGDIQMVSFQFGVYSISTDGGMNFSGGVDVQGSFVNRSDYDDNADILYAQTGLGDFYRHPINGEGGPVQLSSFSMSPTAVFADPNVDHRVYFGTGQGQVIRVDNANEGDNLPASELADFQGSISSIIVEDGDPDHILVTLGNYGLVNNIYESTDGGASWQGIEGSAVANNLPDMPVRDIVLNPSDPDQAFIATELGVWSTDNIDGSNTIWYPPALGIGIPTVRTDDLQVRASDNMVLAGTYGRGMFSTTVFSEPLVRPVVKRVHYTDSPLQFIGETSYNADDFTWDFGDGATSNEANPEYTYEEIGTYTAKLGINNNSLVEEVSVKILPDVQLPYNEEADNWGGGFESELQQYGVNTVSGSAWSRGNSSFNGKSGTSSGANAFVVGQNEQYVQALTNTELYLPNFDFSEEGIYEISFDGKWNMHPGLDGMQVQYSTDRGQTWRQLGDKGGDWYGYTQSGLQGAPFNDGQSYFTREQFSWETFTTNISELGGNDDVAIRFVFKSDATGNYPGVAIDNVKLSKFTGELQTIITSVNAEFTDPTEITVTWTTSPEYFADFFVLERSENGRDWTEVTTVGASGGTTLEAQTYSEDFLAQKNLYFVRIRSVNVNEDNQYEYIFTSDIVVINRNEDAATEILNVFPNPFEDRISLTFNKLLLNTPIRTELYDAAGRRILARTLSTDGTTPFYEVPLQGDLAVGMYYLSIWVGEEEPIVFPLNKAPQ